MKKTSSYKLSIENPCQENWDGMEMSEIGKFCQLCQKNVLDFTMMSDREIIRYLENHQNEKICGRVANVDLNRDLVQTELVSKNSWKFKVVSCIVFLSTIFSSKLFAQKNNSIKKTHKVQDNKANHVFDTIIPLESISTKTKVLPDTFTFIQKKTISNNTQLINSLQGLVGGVCIQKVKHGRKKKSKK